MQFKVPQKIDIEDKIVGPLTMVQFVYAVIGGGAAYICLTTFPAGLNYICAVLIAMFTFFIVFVKINGRPFGYFLKNLLVYIFNPKTRIWNKGQSDVR
ncbi:MAG: PrgI family protein, partial [Candidatus Berkelbacteria bacterium]|nr:PrgI family protein [Candidatus Berkelbacteria bacterium]